jgi:decaprenylphospho-beta-D-erythro-pentofuranosid-2-ulose 2-reductase
LVLSKTALFVTPAQVAKGIVSAVEKRKDVVYVPGFCAGIMLIIRLIPGRIFKKLNL